MTDGASEGCGQLPLADGHRVENGEQVPLHDGPLQRRHGVRSGRPLDEFTEERDGFRCMLPLSRSSKCGGSSRSGGTDFPFGARVMRAEESRFHRCCGSLSFRETGVGSPARAGRTLKRTANTINAHQCRSLSEWKLILAGCLISGIGNDGSRDDLLEHIAAGVGRRGERPDRSGIRWRRFREQNIRQQVTEHRRSWTAS